MIWLSTEGLQRVEFPFPNSETHTYVPNLCRRSRHTPAAQSLGKKGRNTIATKLDINLILYNVDCFIIFVA